jgi:hypothetical protein
MINPRKACDACRNKRVKCEAPPYPCLRCLNYELACEPPDHNAVLEERIATGKAIVSKTKSKSSMYPNVPTLPTPHFTLPKITTSVQELQVGDLNGLFAPHADYLTQFDKDALEDAPTPVDEVEDGFPLAIPPRSVSNLRFRMIPDSLVVPLDLFQKKDLLEEIVLEADLKLSRDAMLDVLNVYMARFGTGYHMVHPDSFWESLRSQRGMWYDKTLIVSMLAIAAPLSRHEEVRLVGMGSVKWKLLRLARDLVFETLATPQGAAKLTTLIATVHLAAIVFYMGRGPVATRLANLTRALIQHQGIHKLDADSVHPRNLEPTEWLYEVSNEDVGKIWHEEDVHNPGQYVILEVKRRIQWLSWISGVAVSSINQERGWMSRELLGKTNMPCDDLLWILPVKSLFPTPKSPWPGSLMDASMVFRWIDMEGEEKERIMDKTIRNIENIGPWTWLLLVWELSGRIMDLHLWARENDIDFVNPAGGDEEKVEVLLTNKKKYKRAILDFLQSLPHEIQEPAQLGDGATLYNYFLRLWGKAPYASHVCTGIAHLNMLMFALYMPWELQNAVSMPLGGTNPLYLTDHIEECLEYAIIVTRIFDGLVDMNPKLEWLLPTTSADPILRAGLVHVEAWKLLQDRKSEVADAVKGDVKATLRMLEALSKFGGWCQHVYVVYKRLVQGEAVPDDEAEELKMSTRLDGQVDRFARPDEKPFDK